MNRLLKGGLAASCFYVSSMLYMMGHPITLALAAGMGVGGLILTKQALVGTSEE